MFGVSPGRPHRLDVFVGDFTERLAAMRDFPQGASLGDRIAAFGEHIAGILSETPSGVQRYSALGGRSKSHFTLLTVQAIHEHPAPGALRVDRQIEVAAVGMPARLSQCLCLSG